MRSSDNDRLVTPTVTVIGSALGRLKRGIHPLVPLSLLCCLLLIVTFFTTLLSWALPVRQLLAQSTAAQTGTSTVQRIHNRGDLLIAGVLYDYKPFGFLDTKGVPTGFDVDLVNALAAQWGVEVQFVPVTPSTRLQSLMAGQVDLVAAALPHTVAAEANIDFSNSYFTDQPSLLLRADGPVSLNALAGRVVAAVQGDSALAQLQLILAQSNTNLTVLPFQEYAPALLALGAGQADALLGHSVHLAQVAQEQLGVSLILPIDGSDTFALGVAPGDAHFRALVDATLQELQQAGIYAELYAKWFPDQSPPSLATLPGKWPYTLETMPTTLARPNPSRLAQLRARGQLIVGVPSDLPPFGAVDATGAIRGFDVEIAQALAQRWLGDIDALELVRVSADTAMPLLQAGQVDLVIAALPHTWENEAQIDFSLNYFVDTQRLLVRTDSLITQATDLTGQTIATVAGADTPAHIAAHLAESGISQVDILPFQEYRSAEQALRAGQVDALLGSTVVFSGSIQSDGNVRMLPVVVDQLPYAIGIGQFDDELRDLVNITLQAMQADGTYGAIYQRWFPNAPYTLTTWSGATLATPAVAQSAQPVGSTTETVVPPITPITTTTTITGVITPGPTRRLTILVPTATPASATTIAMRTTVTRTTVTRTTVAGLRPTATPTSTVVGTQLAKLTPAATPTATLLLTTSTLTASLVLSSPLPITSRADLQATRAETTTTALTATLPPTATLSPTGTPITLLDALTATVALSTSLPIPTATPTLTPTRPTTVTVLSTLNLNARTRPESTAPILMVLPGASQWRVVDVTADGTWVRLSLSNGLQGWVLRTLLAEAAAFPLTVQPTVPAPAAPVPTPTSTPVILLLTTPTPLPGVVAADGSTRHRVTATDTLATIAQQYYGQQRLWTLLYTTNLAVIGDDPNAIPVGVELIIPPLP